jgi:RND family efflux transporter MFP subunit
MSCFLALASLGGPLEGCRPGSRPRAEESGVNRSGQAPAAREVQLERAVLSSLQQSIEISGTLAADEHVIVSAKVPGRLDSISVDLATPVKRGQAIAQIETTDYEFGVQQAEAAVGQARAQLGLPPTRSAAKFDPEATALVRQARATLDEASASAARLQRLSTEGLTPQAELETAQASFARAAAALETAREEVRIRQAQLHERESDLAVARQRLSDSTIRSPIDGFVQARRASTGEYLAAGAPVAEVVRIDPLRLRLALPEREAASVRSGQTVQVVTDASGAAYAGATHTGVVARLAPSLDAQSRTLLIEADIPNPGTLRPGNFVRARILIGAREAPTVPQSSVVTFAGLQKVILVHDGKALEQAVTTGQVEGDRVEILSGIKVGDAVVKLPGTLQQGQAVQVVEGAPSDAAK